MSDQLLTDKRRQMDVRSSAKRQKMTDGCQIKC